MPNPMTFGDLMRTTRAALDLTQADLAERLEVQVGHISKLERGERQPSPRLCRAFADAFDIPRPVALATLSHA